MSDRVHISSPIGVFDSGVGGLSILAALRRELPHENFVYFADQAHVPYGDKDKAFIVERSHTIARMLQARGAKLLVVACNTATAMAVDEMRASYSIPVIGIEPAVKPAAQASQRGLLGVLATPRTLTSERFHSLVQRVAGDAVALLQPCVGWVELVESGDLQDAESVIAPALDPLLRSGVDALVLGCTHYPFLRAQIQKYVGPSVQIFDSAEGVARQVRRVLTERDALNLHGGSCELLSSGDQERFVQHASRLLISI